MLRLARGLSFRESGLFSFQSLSTDLVLAMLGVATAALLALEPLADRRSRVAPLFLIHRSLSVPQLQEEARVDPKTGLFNARHFAAALHEELDAGGALRAAAVARSWPTSTCCATSTTPTATSPATRSSQGIAEVFRAQLRHYDIPARFGGEEFAILLPETPPEQALEIAERIRRAVARARRSTSRPRASRSSATVSIGVAALPARRRRRERARSTRPTSRSTGPSSRAATASSTPARSRCSLAGASAARLVAVPEDGEHRRTAAAARPTDAARTLERRAPAPARAPRAALPLALAAPRDLRRRRSASSASPPASAG